MDFVVFDVVCSDIVYTIVCDNVVLGINIIMYVHKRIIIDTGCAVAAKQKNINVQRSDAKTETSRWLIRCRLFRCNISSTAVIHAASIVMAASADNFVSLQRYNYEIDWLIINK